MASIQEYGGKWRVQVYKNGVRKSAVWDTKRQAQAWAVKVEAELSMQPTTRGGGKTFADAVTLYLQSVSSRKKGRAPEWEAARLATMTAFFGDKTPLAKITSERVGQWRDHRLATVLGSTVQREANLLRNLLLTARNEWKWISHHPFQGVKLPDSEPQREFVWGWREIRRVLRHCQAGGPKTQEMGRAFHLSLRTAMRLKEVLQARLLGNIAVLSDTKGTKKGQAVKVPLTRQGRRLLAKTPPFTIKPNEASALFSQICKDCNVRTKGEDGATFHDARATALTLMSRKMDVQTLQRISRHRDINILIRAYFRESAESIAARI